MPDLIATPFGRGRVLGIDVARTGGELTVMELRENGVTKMRFLSTAEDAEQTAVRALKLARDLYTDIVDCTQVGIGSSVHNRIIELLGAKH